MKFIIESTNWYEPDKIIEYYPCLYDLGFDRETVKQPLFEYVKDENGKKILQISGYKDKEKCSINIYSLEELLALMKAVDRELVIYFDGDIGRYVIEIYDGFRE